MRPYEDSTIKHAPLGVRLALVAGLCTGLAHAAPEDGRVESGSADIDVVGDSTTITTGHKTIMSWSSFDIGSNESVEFVMPGSSSRVLNRINSATPTVIDGALTANGQVYLVNQSGIVFGADSVVNVGALYAAAGNISDADFMSGADRFTGLSGTVENRGAISADMVALLGARVTNIGSISAPEGTVVMAAGEEVMIGNPLGHTFVSIEAPTQNPATPGGGSDLVAGDTVSVAAFHSGSIDAGRAVVAAEGGDTVVSGSVRGTQDGVEIQGDNLILERGVDGLARGGAPITGPSVTLTAAPGGMIDLGTDIHATVDDVVMNGDVRLTDSVTLTASGFQGMVIADGDIYSESGAFHDLTVNAPTGLVEFRGALGDMIDNGAGTTGSGTPITGIPGSFGSVTTTTGSVFSGFEVTPGTGGPGGDIRLGKLTVDAALALFEHDVLTLNGMNIFSEAGVTGESVTFHTGIGDSLFADHVYSAERGASDVAFMYDGGVSTGVGSQRTPFSFRANIGTPPVTRLIPNSGAFRSIRMGADAGAFLPSASFFFSTGAMGDGVLADASMIDTTEQFFVTATESVLVGRGQKITAHGSIQLAARGNGATHIEASDINALGDITLFSRGRMGNTITLLRHEGGFIDGVGNEPDRSGGGYEEMGAELLAGGDITLVGDLAPDTSGISMGYDPFVIANATGSGSALGLGIDALGFNPATLAEFLGTEPSSTGGAYSYDLTLGDFVSFGPPTPMSLANLAEGLADENTLSIRDDEPYLAQREVLRELGLNPVDPAPQTHTNAASDGRERYLDARGTPSGLTIDRLSRRSVALFVDAYIDLLGERDPATGRRSGLDEIHAALTAESADRERVITRIRGLLDRLRMMELTPLERRRARSNLLDIIVPDGFDPGDVEFLTAMK